MGRSPPPIRIAVAQDREAVVALWEACGLTRPWNDPRADFDRALERGAVLVAGACAGTVMVGDDGHRGWIYYCAVDPAARGRGLGRALVAAAEDWLRARGCPKLQLMVRADNRAALGFYAALGLEVQDVALLGKRLDAA
jgi:ribosomal protein S18 acetylase RimI-like enzyme